MAVLGAGNASSPARLAAARESSGEPEREPGRGSLGSAPIDLLPGTALALAAGSAATRGGSKRRVSHSPPSRTAACGDAARCSPEVAACREGRGGCRGESGVGDESAWVVVGARTTVGVGLWGGAGE